MAPVTEERLRELRLRYKAAYTAYQSCVLALNEAASSGKPPSPELLRIEATALLELNDARAKRLAALGELANESPF